MNKFPPHFDGKRFYNPGVPPPRGLRDVLRWKLTSRAHPSPKFVDDVTPSKPPARGNGDTSRTTLVNHSTVLLQWNGLNILTDPIWSERASPFSWIGPRRKRPPGVLEADLPTIDLVLLSHNHYDHLDVPTLRRLIERDHPLVVVPLGLSQFLQRMKADPVHELDWGESVSLGPLTVHSVPAVHFSARSIGDRNKTLWCGYILRSRDKTIYYAGDTAFSPHFQAIRDHFGPPQLSLLPVGAYLPRWFMSAVHMGPEQALEAHHILGSGTSIAIHHGTFQLADDAPDEAVRALQAAGLPASFLVLRNGECCESAL